MFCFWLVLLAMSTWDFGQPQFDESHVIETVRPYLRDVAQSFDQIPAERRTVLETLARNIREQRSADRPAQLIFICTHNSRRSHLAQVWCQIAAAYYQVPGVATYSGGTAATACNLRTIQALRRAGLSVVAATAGENPRYLVQYSDQAEPLRVYSKVFNAEENPHQDFAAVLCCADADESCPVVSGATLRIPLHYLDPKVSDGTPQESACYDERCREIAREMMYVMSRVAAR